MGHTQREMADTLAERLHLPTRTARRFVQYFVGMICDQLADEGRVELRGLGIFGLQHRPKHKIHHPKTGKTIQIPDKTEVRFRASIKLRRRLNTTGKKGKKPKPDQGPVEHDEPVEHDGLVDHTESKTGKVKKKKKKKH